jgi:hypothetical protein
MKCREGEDNCITWIGVMFYSSPSTIRNIKRRRTRWAGYVARMGEKRTAYRFLVGRSDGNRPLGKPKFRWVENIRLDRVEIRWSGVDWAVVNVAMSIPVPQIAGNSLTC